MVLEPILPLHKVVPMWSLPLAGGGPTFSLHKPRGRAHTVLLVASVEVDVAPYMAELAPQLDELWSLPAQGVAALSPRLTDLGPATYIPRAPAPWKVVFDVEAKVRHSYLPDRALAGVFILDRYNDLYQQWVSTAVSDLPTPSTVVEWIEAVGRQCGI